jgi:cobalt-zinc-cadmium efflux system protein
MTPPGHSPPDTRSGPAGRGHSHLHGLTATGRHRRALTAVLALTTMIAIAEVIGALITGSLVLIADAAHMTADAAGVGLLFGMAVFIFIEAIRRLISPSPVQSGLLIVFGVIALAANGASLLLLRRGQAESLNLRGAFLEVASDTLGAAAVIVTGIVIAATGFTRADPIASLAVGLLILPRTWQLLREAVDVLLEASPRGIDLTEVRRHMTELGGVRGVHELHAWTITSGLPVLSAHVVVDAEILADGRSGVMLDRLQDCLRGHFDVEHSTFQLELAGHVDHEDPMHQ